MIKEKEAYENSAFPPLVLYPFFSFRGSTVLVFFFSCGGGVVGKAEMKGGRYQRHVYESRQS